MWNTLGLSWGQLIAGELRHPKLSTKAKLRRCNSLHSHKSSVQSGHPSFQRCQASKSTCKSSQQQKMKKTREEMREDQEQKKEEKIKNEGRERSRKEIGKEEQEEKRKRQPMGRAKPKEPHRSRGGRGKSAHLRKQKPRDLSEATAAITTILPPPLPTYIARVLMTCHVR